MSTPPGPPVDPYDPRHQQQGPRGGAPDPGPGTPPAGQPQYAYPPPPGYPQQQGPGAPGQPSAGYPQSGYGPPPGYGQQPGYPQYPGGGYGAPGQPPEDPLVPADIGGWVQRIIGVVQRSFVPLLLITLAIFGAIVVLSILAGLGISGVFFASLSAGGPGAGAIVTAIVIGLVVLVAMLLVGSLAQAAGFFVAVKQANGEDASLGSALAFARTRMLAVAGWSLLAGLMIAVGTLLVIVPGVYLAIVFGASLFGVVIAERQGIGRCFTLVHNRFWPTVGRMLLYFAVVAVYALLVGLIVSAFGEGSLVGSLVQFVLTVPITIVGFAVAVVTYAELRFHDPERPGALTPALAAELRP